MSSRTKPRGKGRVKRQAIESEDGWTVITHGLSKMKVDDGKEKKKKKATAGKKIAGQLPSKTVKGLSAEKLSAEFEKAGEKWKDTGVAKQVEALKNCPVKEAVCIGIGSFSRDWEHRHRSMWQLVLFMHVVRHLSHDEGNVQLFAQDPAFTPTDVEFLSLLNVTVLDTGIEKHITPHSFVYSPFMDWFVLLPMFLVGKDPALYVGNEILDDYTVYAQTEDKKDKLDECNEAGKTFLANREMVKLKDFEHHAHALNGMVVYSKSATDALT
jgi:hypothetical protein